MSECYTCQGTGVEEFCSSCNDPLDECECKQDPPPSVRPEECTECDGTGEVEGEEE